MRKQRHAMRPATRKQRHAMRKQGHAIQKQSPAMRYVDEQSFQSLQTVYEQYFQEGAPRPLCLTTGFSALDKLLGGGLLPGLIVLGGMPAVGKSTLALQIAAHVAEGGRPVLYFSMEMPRSQLMAKAVSRRLYQDAGPGSEQAKRCLTAQKLLDLSGGRQAGFRVKGMNFLQNLHVCDKPLTASKILEQVMAFSEREKKKPALVVVDYLQLLPRERGQSDKQIVDNNIIELKKLADGQQDVLPVLLLSSLNRSAYTNTNSYPYAGRNSRSGKELVGPIQIGSFKETGGIEYSASLLLGLEYRASLDRLADKKAEEKKDPREMALTVLKNRNGKSSFSIPLQYDPSHDCFFPPGGGAGRAAAPDESGDSPPPAGLDGWPQEPMEDSGIRVILNNTKAANELRKGEGVRKTCSWSFNTEQEHGKEVSCSLSAPLSSLDFCVADAVYSLDRFKKKISLRAVFQVLLGSKEGNLNSDKQRQLEASIQRLRTTELELDCREHLEQMHTDAWSYRGPFLRLDGPDDRGVYRRPQLTDDAGILPLHTYGAAVGQMITVPAVLLDVKDPRGRRLSNTVDNICLKWFLLHRLEVIRYLLKNGGKFLEQMRTISFAPDRSLLKEVRPAEPQSVQAAAQRTARLHDTTELILNYYRRIGYLSAVEQHKPNGRARLTDFKILDEYMEDPKNLLKGSG